MAQPRGQWSGRLGFILAASGSAIGLGNLWKLPYITFENRGGAFLLVYIAAVLVVGIPIMTAEILLGRKTQRDPVGAFKLLAAGKPGGSAWAGVGFLGVTAGFVILSYYCVVAGWTLHYMLIAAKGTLGQMAQDPAVLQNYFVTDFLGNGVEQVVYQLLFMALTIGAVYFGVRGGIERVARGLMPVLFTILVALLVYVMTTPSFGEAVRFLFRPNFGELSKGGVLEAVGHAFFTLSLGMGAMLTYGSYLRRDQSVPWSALQISALDTVIGIFACLIMFSIIFSSDMEVTKSATILFTTLPTVFVQMPGGAWVMGFFYMLVGFAALTSTISLLEVVSSYAIDELKWSRHRAVLTMGAIVASFGVLSALSLGASERLSGVNLIGKESTAGVFGTLDYLASNWFLPVGGLLIALFTGWILGRKETQAELEEGHGPMRSYGLWRFAIRFAAPIAVGAIIVSVILGAEYQ